MRRAGLCLALIIGAAACAAPAVPMSSPPVPSASGATPSASAPPEGSASVLAVTPLIPDLVAGGTLQLLTESGTVTATLPASRPLQLFGPFGDGFLVGEQRDGQLSALGVLSPQGALSPMTSPADISDVHGVAGSPDGHAMAWLQGAAASGLCAGGVSSGTLYVQEPGGQPHELAQLAPGPAGSSWVMGGYMGTTIWVLRQGGCPDTAAYSVSSYTIAETGSSLHSVQPLLGAGCALQAVALDSSMLCAAQPWNPVTATWRYVSASGAAHDFTAASLGTPCAGYGPLHDFEGFVLSADGRYIAVDAGCVGGSRFDRPFIVTTATGAVTGVRGAPYLAADSFLPDDSLLCNDLGDVNNAVAYVVPPSGGAPRMLAAGQATWAGNGVIW